MNTIHKINGDHPDLTVIRKAVNCLKEGGLIIIPTETVYGIACDPNHIEAFNRIRVVKGRDEKKPIARLVASVKQAKEIAINWNQGIEALCNQFWPGPLTLVLQTKEGWTGFRVPDHPIPLAIADIFGSSIALTSANLSGENDARTATETNHLSVDLVLDSGSTGKNTTPSSVVKIDNNNFQGLREGSLTFKELESVFKKGINS